MVFQEDALLRSRAMGGASGSAHWGGGGGARRGRAASPSRSPKRCSPTRTPRSPRARIPRDACDRACSAFDHAVGRSGPDLRRGFAVLSFVLEWLPLLVVGAPSRMSKLPMDWRIAYLEALESSRIGLLAMLMVAFKVPLCIPAFEEGDEVRLTALRSTSTDRAGAYFSRRCQGGVRAGRSIPSQRI